MYNLGQTKKFDHSIKLEAAFPPNSTGIFMRIIYERLGEYLQKPKGPSCR